MDERRVSDHGSRFNHLDRPILSRADFDLYDSDGGFHFADGHVSADLDWAWHVGGRLGTLVASRVLSTALAAIHRAT